MRFVLFALFMIGAAMTAQAFTTPVTDKKRQAVVQDVGKGFMAVAERLGFSHFAWGNVVQNGAVIVLEYLPDDKTKVESWNKMMTVTAYALSGDPKQDVQIMGSIQGGLIKAYGTQGKIVQTEYYTQGPDKYPAAFIEYKIGEGAQAEHNAGALIKPGAKLAAFIQTQCRGACKALSAEEIAVVHSLVGGGGQNGAPAPQKK